MTGSQTPQDVQRDKNLVHDLFIAAKTFPPGAVLFSNIVESLETRSFGLAILIFSVPMIVPMPPGIPLAAGGVIMLLAVQLIIGRDHLWLPNWLGQKAVEREKLIKAYALVDRYMGWMFRLTRPRLPQLTGPIMRRITGVFFAVLGALMILPIPFIGNIVPAFACTVLALALTDRDGLFYLIGLVIAVLAILVTAMMGIATFNFIDAVLFNP